MELSTLRAFARVAELGSFTQAADQLGLAKGRVSALVQALEAEVGSRLLLRTTRRVSLTPDGERFLERCQELLADAEQLQTLFTPGTSGLRGRLRVDLPNALARDLVIPHLPTFMARHPQLELAISTTDRRVDLVQEGFDCVLRAGPLAESELVARPLGELPMLNVASPAYLAAHGTPRTLDDLATHRVVHYSPRLGPQGAGWEYLEEGQPRLRPMRHSLTVNGTDAYTAAALAGLGLIQAPARGLRRLVAAGLLVEVLPAWRAAPLPLTLLYAHRRHLPPRVTAFMQWLAELLAQDAPGG